MNRIFSASVKDSYRYSGVLAVFQHLVLRHDTALLQHYTDVLMALKPPQQIPSALHGCEVTEAYGLQLSRVLDVFSDGSAVLDRLALVPKGKDQLVLEDESGRFSATEVTLIATGCYNPVFRVAAQRARTVFHLSQGYFL